MLNVRVGIVSLPGVHAALRFNLMADRIDSRMMDAFDIDSNSNLVQALSQLYLAPFRCPSTHCRLDPLGL